jgi:hypothetical protein
MNSSDLVRIGALAGVGAIMWLAGGPARAQDADFSQLPIYRELRGALIAQGWRPDAGFGLKLPSGKPLYRFPEVLCGPKICHAHWLRSGGEKTVTLIRGDLTEEYRVAP